MRTLLIVALCLQPTLARADDPAAAAEHFRKGTALYDTGDYAAAAAEYNLAFQAKEDPALLYNIGQAQRLAGHPQEAVSAYRGYLRRAPRARNRPEVEGRVRELQEALERQRMEPPRPAPEPTPAATPVVAPTPTPAPIVEVAPPAPPPKKALYKKWWLWTAVAGGAVAIGLGVGLGVGLTRDRFDPSLGRLGPGALGVTP